MKTRLMLNLSLLIVIAVLAAVVVLKPGKQSEAVIPLTSLDPASLKRVTLKNPETLVFEKQDSLWRLTAPFAAPVNQIRLGKLLEIAQAPSVARYPLNPQALAQFGLDKPEMVLQLDDTVLQIGGSDPINMRRYVRVGDTLHLVEDAFYHNLIATALDYVDKKLVPEGTRIREIQLPGFKASKNAEGRWTTEPAGPTNTPAEEQALTWETAWAIKTQRLAAGHAAETIRLVPSAGAPIEFLIVQKQPTLILGRKDLGFQFEVPEYTARKLLNLPPPGGQKPQASSPVGAEGSDGEDSDDLGPNDDDAHHEESPEEDDAEGPDRD